MRGQHTLGLLLVGAGLYFKDFGQVLVRAGDHLCSSAALRHPAYSPNGDLDHDLARVK